MGCQYWTHLSGGRSLLAGDPGRGQSVNYKIARKQAPTKTPLAANIGLICLEAGACLQAIQDVVSR
jgi:hypothetical protein